ncbi:MAG: DUF448 domain-containing protein [Actinomycetota bacterium]|nr:DUF448 domain-containing protein [Actinomycetota bacterium]
MGRGGPSGRGGRARAGGASRGRRRPGAREGGRAVVAVRRAPPGGASRGDPAAAPVEGPVRTCVGCRSRRSPRELVRVSVARDGTLRRGRGAGGRGAWLCAGSRECASEAMRRRALARALRVGPDSRELESFVATLLAAPSSESGHRSDVGVRG